MAKANRARSNKKNEKTDNARPQGDVVALDTEAPPTRVTNEPTTEGTTTSSLDLAMADPPEEPSVEQITIASIKRDEKLNFRTRLDERVVAQYASLMGNGTVFPPVVVFRDEKDRLLLADGFHGCAAAIEAAMTEISAEVRTGDRRAAILYALGANSKHGLPRTNREKRTAVEMLLRDKEWREWKDQAIADWCGTSREFIVRMRAKVIGSQSRKPREQATTQKQAFNIERATTKFVDQFDELIEQYDPLIKHLGNDSHALARVAMLVSERLPALARTGSQPKKHARGEEVAA